MYGRNHNKYKSKKCEDSVGRFYYSQLYRLRLYTIFLRYLYCTKSLMVNCDVNIVDNIYYNWFSLDSQMSIHTYSLEHEVIVYRYCHDKYHSLDSPS